MHGARVRMGERLAAEAPVEADLVLPIPDSGTPAAIGFSRATGIPFSEGLIKNRYVERTFIQPDQELRRAGHQAEVQPGRRGRGQARRRRSTTRSSAATRRAQIVRMLFDAGAAEVHVRVSAPPVIGQCFYGIDLADPRRDDRVDPHGRGDPRAHRRDLARVPLARGAREATQRPAHALCRACLTGDYPTEVPAERGEAQVRDLHVLDELLRARLERTRTSSGSWYTGRAVGACMSTTEATGTWSSSSASATGRHDSEERGGELEASELTSSRPAEVDAAGDRVDDAALDKTGAVTAQLAEVTDVSIRPGGGAARRVRQLLYRSAKNARAGLELGALLDAQESIAYYLEFVFAAHGRVRPYNKWLEWELREHPLPATVDLSRLEQIARTGDSRQQRALPGHRGAGARAGPARRSTTGSRTSRPARSLTGDGLPELEAVPLRSNSQPNGRSRSIGPSAATPRRAAARASRRGRRRGS